MDDLKRRQFLHFSLAFSSSWLAACGSTSGDPAVTSPAPPAPAPAPIQSSPTPSPPAPTPAPAPAPAATGSMAFTLSSPAAAAAAPFCIGFAFRQTDIPSGQGVVGSLAGLQVTPLNRWPDGSLKFALVAGRAALAAGTPSTVTLSAGSAAAGSALALSDLQATGVTAAVGCGSFGTVSWASADWASPFLAFAAGPEMSSWIYRKPVGTDPHLVAWLEVRVYADGSVEVLPWIENGYIHVANPVNKAATYQFTLGGTVRYSGAFDLAARTRTPLLDGTKLSHWLGTDPGVIARHDVDYLQSTELVPAYRAQVASDSTLVTQLAASYTPLQQGDFAYSQDAMGSAGYAAPIGPLPQHDMLYLVADSMSIGPVIQRDGYSAGRYPIHYRDETTNKPLRFSAHPNTSTNYSSTNDYPAVASGTVPPQWEVAHSPSVGYMAYLLSGRYYFLEQAQFAATANYLFSTDGLRNYGDGWFEPVPGAVQVRQCAWAFRALMHALVVTPDADATLQAEFAASVTANVTRFHTRYCAQANNPLGFIQPDLDYSIQYGPTSAAAATGVMAAGWMQDFFTGVYGWALAMDLPGLTSATKANLQEFFFWKAQGIIGRLGTQASGYWYINAATYNIAISANHQPDFAGGTGPWISWAQCYTATEAVAETGQLAAFGTTEGMLAAEIMPGADSMWGNLQPAIAYAVRHGVPGASDAYARMTSATNWPALQAEFNQIPVWSVEPLA